MIKHAKEIGFTELGISDHLIAHPFLNKNLTPFEQPSFECMYEWTAKRAAEIRQLSKEENFPVYVGYEVDFFEFDGWKEGFESFCAQADYDYLICGHHFIWDEELREIGGLTRLKESSLEEKLYPVYFKKYFENLTQAVYSQYFDFFAHLDFIRWSGFCGTDDFKEERMAVIEALDKTQTPIELNTKGVSKIGDFYPAKWMLKELKSRHIPILISDDAHSIADQGADFQLAEDYLKELGYTNRITMKELLWYRKRK